MILSRQKPATAANAAQNSVKDKDKKQIPTLDIFLQNRDYTGAMTLLEFEKNSGKSSFENDMWYAYAAFHLGEYKTAMEQYEKLAKKEKQSDIWTFLGCCCFMLGMYTEAQSAAEKAKNSPLQNRLLFHLAQKFNDERRLMEFHANLHDVIEDQLSLASIHYLRNHYQEAIDIYKRILLDSKEYLALKVYIALCYYKLDYYDVSQEILAGYISQHADSATALNLKACNQFRLFNGRAAEAEIKILQELASPSFTYAQDLVKHNLVVFRNGQGALQVLPPLVDIIPEARLNLVIYYLKQDNIVEAYELMKDVVPTAPQEYILKAVVSVSMGQEQGSKELLKEAEQYFHFVGASASECDTIPGRQCQASAYFLMKEFNDVLTYLTSIKSYFNNDDCFNFNYGQAMAITGNYKDAETVFEQIQSEKIRSDYVYIGWLARCHIMNKKPQLAWELYLIMEASAESYCLLQIIANDCYKVGLFYYSAKAFDCLERLEPNPEYWEGKRGACVGVLQMIIAGKEPKETLQDVIQLLRNTPNPQVDIILRIMDKWARDNKLKIM